MPLQVPRGVHHTATGPFVVDMIIRHCCPNIHRADIPQTTQRLVDMEMAHENLFDEGDAYSMEIVLGLLRERHHLIAVNQGRIPVIPQQAVAIVTRYGVGIFTVLIRLPSYRDREPWGRYGYSTDIVNGTANLLLYFQQIQQLPHAQTHVLVRIQTCDTQGCSNIATEACPCELHLVCDQCTHPSQCLVCKAAWPQQSLRLLELELELY